MQWKEFRSHVSYLSEEDLERVYKAFELAQELHNGQKRKSGEPYFTHPVAVAGILADMHADVDTIIAALLHDTVEDTPITLEEIRLQFNHSVPELIDGVTKLTSEDIKGKPSLDEQIETLRKMFDLMRSDVRIMVIKLADRLHNMQTIEFLSEERRKTMAKETMDVYVKIADRLSMMDFHDELEALCLSVVEPELLNQLRQLRNANEQLGKRVLDEMKTTLLKEYLKESEHISFMYEKKTWDKLRQQLASEGSAVTGLSAITIAFVCPNIDTCYRVMGALHQAWQRETLSFQDYINSPMLNGYRGLHTTIILADGTRVRCKIRTHEMQEYAHDGITSLCFGQRVKKLGEILPWTKRISALTTDTQNKSNEFWDNLQGDILGEFIIIHGPGDQTISVPKGATALDGAFYLFGSIALRTKNILVNGKTIEFDMPLRPADAVTIDTGERQIATHEWLKFVHAGLSTATIRHYLRSKPQQEKIEMGKSILSAYLSNQKRGMLAEFDEKKMTEQLKSIQLHSMNEAYEALSDGDLAIDELFEILFENKNWQPLKKEIYVVEGCFNDITSSNKKTLSILEEQYEWHSFEIVQQHKSRLSYCFRGNLPLTKHERTILIEHLRAIGASDVRLRTRKQKNTHIIIAIALILIWGLDPVIASNFIAAGFSPADLTIVRFLTAFTVSIINYAFFVQFVESRLKRLSPFNMKLFLAGTSLFITSLLTYIALRTLSPAQYILFILGGQILTIGVEKMLHKQSSKIPIIAFILVLVALVNVDDVSQMQTIGILAGIASSLSFSLYSKISESYQKQHFLLRYPAYLLWVSMIGAVFAMTLLPWSTLSSQSQVLITEAVGYTFLFTFVPYVLYFVAMRNLGQKYLNSILPLTTLLTVLSTMNTHFANAHYIAAVLLTACSLYVLSRKTEHY